MLDFLRDNNLIEFHAAKEILSLDLHPKPAYKTVPEWFKAVMPYADKRDPTTHEPTMTIKKCLPVLDAMSLGYTLFLQADLYVVSNHDCSVLDIHESRPQIKGIDRHSWDQIKSSKWPGFKQDPMKFINHYHIKTRPGWSCLFVSPLNEMNQNFECLSGVVDTDTYPGIINFPAVWKTPNFDGEIRAGTPLVTVIPFKRKDFNYKNTIVRESTEKEKEELNDLVLKQNSRGHVYTWELREKR